MNDGAEKNMPETPKEDTNPVFEQLQQLEQATEPAFEEAQDSADSQQKVENAEQQIASSEQSEENSSQDQTPKKKFDSLLKKGKQIWKNGKGFIGGIGEKEGSPLHFLHKSREVQDTEDKIVHNIVAQGQDAKEKAEKEGVEGEKNVFTQETKLSPEQIAQQKIEKKGAEELLRFSKVLVISALVVPVLSFLLGSLLTNTSGFLSTALEDKNYALNFREKTENLHRLKTFINSQEKSIEEMNEQIARVKENKVLAEIVDSRIHWREVFETINRITDTAFEGNRISKYVIYNSYDGSSKDKTIHVDGNVRSLVGASWQDLIKLRNVLSSHENFEPEQIYFRQFVKQKSQTNSQIATSEYTTPFSLTFKYIREDEGVDDADNMHAAQ